MLWTHPRSIMDPPEVPNLKVLYQREYISIIRGNIISMIGRLLLLRCTILSGKKKDFLSKNPVHDIVLEIEPAMSNAPALYRLCSGK